MGVMNGQAAMPIMMNYGMTAFDMGIEGGNRPPTPKYSPPPEPEAGFTRSPEENEVVVCPNCGDELAMGDSDVKQEVWVVKGCGHVSFSSS
jgi:pre-mRNA-processing factor 19